MVITGRAPYLSSARPMNGATSAETAENDSDAVTSVRLHPNSFSSGSTKTPKA